MSTPQGWDEERTACWLAIAEHRERQLAPVSTALFEGAALESGERVLDVGCGTGSTTKQAHELVGPDGRVTGTDVSVGMIDAARRATAGLDIEWLVGDAQTTDFGEARYDVILSRFGVMFFADTAAAFANLSRACAPTGRLAMVVWRPRPEAPVFAVSQQAVAEVLRAAGQAVPELPVSPGPTALGDREATAAMLHDSGWRDIVFTAPEVPFYVEGGRPPAEAADEALRGPTGRLLEGQPDDVVAAARDAVTAAYAERWDGEGILVHGGFWLVTARPAA